MASAREKSVRKCLDQLEGQLAVANPDVLACRATCANLRGRIEVLLDLHPPAPRLPARVWSDALLTQARADLAAAEVIAERGAPAEVLAMLIQMVFEKLAKAVLTRTDVSCFVANRTSHAVASTLVAAIKNQNEYLDLRYRWKDVLPMVQALERAHPAIAKGGPHLEYPWEAGLEMGLPATHLPIVKQLADPSDTKGPKLLRFARELSNKFDTLFP